MANQLYISNLLPTRFYKIDETVLPQYLSRPFTLFNDRVQRRPWETQVFYNQKWQRSDVLRYQWESNFASIRVQLITCDGAIVLDQLANQVRQNVYMPGFYVYENTISFANIPPGTYWVKLTLGGSEVWISEPQQIAEAWPDTILFEYKNSTFFGDIVFETGITFSFRCEGKIGKYVPGAERTMYRDQRFDPTMLKSVPYRTYPLEIGALNGGVPDWVPDLLNWILSCDYVTIDGQLYALAEDAEFEPGDIDPSYPFRSWSINIQEGVNQSSRVVNPELDTNKRLIVVGMLDPTLFGDLSENAGSNLVPILNVL